FLEYIFIGIISWAFLIISGIYNFSDDMSSSWPGFVFFFCTLFIGVMAGLVILGSGVAVNLKTARGKIISYVIPAVIFFLPMIIGRGKNSWLLLIFGYLAMLLIDTITVRIFIKNQPRYITKKTTTIR
ncbi:MAG: hypothetical protein JW816_03880, partial [Candidatus Buchananbacteria bacterium]|nr:hypothetical protein [Candidatus Buchananbacteria bacterium]